MKTYSRLWAWSIAAVLPSAGFAAGSPATCSAPGITVVADASGDQQGAPADTFADILSLSIAEPPSTDGVNRLVFTFKVADLSVVPPNSQWVVRFLTDVPPPNGDEKYFVAMLTDASGSAHFIYGSEILEAGVGPRVWTPAGELDGASTFNADGTITLVLDESKIGGLGVGGAISAMEPQTRVDFSPTEGSVPFVTGANAAMLDVTDPPDEYDLVGSGSCGSGKSGILGLGAMPLAPLAAMLMLTGLRRRRPRQGETP